MLTDTSNASPHFFPCGGFFPSLVSHSFLWELPVCAVCPTWCQVCSAPLLLNGSGTNFFSILHFPPSGPFFMSTAGECVWGLLPKEGHHCLSNFRSSQKEKRILADSPALYSISPYFFRGKKEDLLPPFFSPNVNKPPGSHLFFCFDFFSRDFLRKNRCLRKWFFSGRGRWIWSPAINPSGIFDLYLKQRGLIWTPLTILKKKMKGRLNTTLEYLPLLTLVSQTRDEMGKMSKYEFANTLGKNISAIFQAP